MRVHTKNVIKTAISIPNELFATVEKFRRKEKLKRSRFIVQAIKDYVHKLENQKLLEEIDNVYSDTKNHDTELLKQMALYTGNTILEKEEW